MKLKRIIAKDFLTYEKLDYNFIDQPLMIQGLNLTDDKQKSNGSGKSSIQAMIEFCITGDNSRGVRDIELIRFGSKKSFLDLYVTCDNRKEEIHINWEIKLKGSNVLKINKTKDGENWEPVVFSTVADGKKWILNWFAISKEDIFNYFIINKTRFKSFFRSSNKEKVELINRFSDASIIDGIEEINSATLDFKYNELKESVLKNEGKVEVLEESLQKELERDFESEYTEKLEEIKEDNLDIDEEITTINLDISAVEEHISEIESEINDFKNSNVKREKQSFSLSKEIEVFNKSFETINESLSIAQTAVESFVEADFDSKIEIHNENLKVLKNNSNEEEGKVKDFNVKEEKVLKILSDLSVKLSGTITCPKCSHNFLLNEDLTIEQLKENETKASSLKKVIERGRNSSKATINSLQNLIIEEDEAISLIKGLEEKEYDKKKVFLLKVQEINVLINEKNAELNILKGNLQSGVNRINLNNTEISKGNNLISSHKQEIENLKSEIETNLKDKVANDNLTNSLKKDNNKAAVKEFKNSIKKIGVKNLSIEKELKEVEDALYKINQWKNNFKQFKMHVANKSLETMEFHCNRYLKGMGSDLKVEFEGYKILANGTVKDEITAKIIRNDERTFNSFSGGEQGRLLFASILANRHMINHTHPYGGFEFLSIDEIFEGVDGIGLQSLVEESKKLQTCIMLITHVTDESVNEDVLKIVKRNGVSRIE